MGAHPYFYFVEYQSDIENALRELREREFDAGRYSSAMELVEFPLGPDSPAPGPKHASIGEVMAQCGASGTRSILDLQFIGKEPELCTAGPLPKEALLGLYGVTEPTHEMVERNMGFFGEIDRGHGIYIVVYKNGVPNELMFAGYSFD